jgi:two-component system cell cycle response regulator
MLTESQPEILLATHDPLLSDAFKPALTATGASVAVADSGDSLLAAMAALPAPALVLLDAKLPHIHVDRLLATARAAAGSNRYPLVLISDTVSHEWHRRLNEGVIDDLIPRSIQNPHWRLRLDMVLRQCHRLLELDRLREASQLSEQFDAMLGIYNRTALLNMLFRETDRVQRMKTPLSLLLFEIDGFDHWKAQRERCFSDALLRMVVERTMRLLRSYDTFGREGSHQFLAILPGCSTVNATILAERIRMEVFSPPFQCAGETMRMSACFGIASSQGRSPVVVLREAEVALQRAQEAGPESILNFTSGKVAEIDPAGFLSDIRPAASPFNQ